MENAVEALKTAAAVLIFIIAITLAFTMFSRAKATTDAIVTSQDRQEYLESEDVDSILYTSSGNIELAGNMTANGDRIVGVEDVISTIYRYNIEKYGVTILKPNGTVGTVLARFDSNTENIMRQYYNIDETKFKEYIEQLEKNIAISASYGVNPDFNYSTRTNNTLYNLYRIEVAGNTEIKCGAPWYGNEQEILRRCNYDIKGGDYELNGQKYKGKNLYADLNGKTIIEVINEIDTSKYLNDDTDGKTNLLQEYQLPTTEIIYIIQ